MHMRLRKAEVVVMGGLTAQLITHDPTDIDLAGLRADRFGPGIQYRVPDIL
jgi:hypothetical protein